MIVYSFKVKGTNNSSKNLDSLYVGVPIADKIDGKGATPFLAGLSILTRSYKIPELEQLAACCHFLETIYHN